MMVESKKESNQIELLKMVQYHYEQKVQVFEFLLHLGFGKD
jgi:hypothetical protein